MDSDLYQLTFGLEVGEQEACANTKTIYYVCCSFFSLDIAESSKRIMPSVLYNPLMNCYQRPLQIRFS